MHDKKYVFILNNEGKGAILPRPAQFGYPPKIAIPNKIPDAPVSKKEYFNTGRLRYSPEVPTGEAMIYTERNFRLNLDDYVGTPPAVEPEPELDEPILWRVYVTQSIPGVIEVMAKSKEEAEELAAERLDEVVEDGDETYEYEAEEAE